MGTLQHILKVMTERRVVVDVYDMTYAIASWLVESGVVINCDPEISVFIHQVFLEINDGEIEIEIFIRGITIWTQNTVSAEFKYYNDTYIPENQVDNQVLSDISAYVKKGR